MNQLFLIRHGLAVAPGTPGFEDDERPLTPKGERRVRMVAQGLRQLKIKPSRIVTSPLPRALRTAEILSEVLRGKDLLETSDALRSGQSADSIRNWIDTRSEETLMLVGHNPAFSELIGLLIAGEPTRTVCELRKGGVAAFRRDPGGAFRLDWIARPRLFRRLIS